VIPDQVRPRAATDEPGAAGVASLPNLIEHPEPGGVNWTIRTSFVGAIVRLLAAPPERDAIGRAEQSVRRQQHRHNPP
jgi:hypothetical protein